MGETEVNKMRINVQKNESIERPSVNVRALRSFIEQFPENLQKLVKSRFKRSTKDEGTNSWISRVKDRESSKILKVNLEKQMQAWKENPAWDDQPPGIKVSVPKDSLCQLNVKVNIGLPPDAVYNIVTDPDNKRVFKNIQEVISRRVLVDEGSRQVVELEQAALWRFLWWSGTISVHVQVDQNREDYSMKFKQVKTGFMKRFEGCWRVEPILLDENFCHPFKPKNLKDYMLCTQGKGRIASQVSLEQYIEPAIVPPPPISWYLRGITTRTTEMLINDLAAEAARIRGVENSERELALPEGLLLDRVQVDELRDIKERWALRRRTAKQCQRRLTLTEKSSS